MRRAQTKVLSILLSLAMLCSLAMPTAFAADSRYNDTTNHWAETAINRWSDYGIVEGYGDAFNPDNSITRGQMATILSKTLGLTEEAENPFSDISADDWYAPYVLRCYKAGIMLGDNGKANPDAEITRQEAMTMFCRAFGIKADKTADLTSFKDSGAVADWALPYVSALINSGIVSGVSSDMIAPTSSMSRAALVTILDRAVVQYINASGEYDLTDSDGIVLVTAADTTLKGETKADILISQATDGKAVTFKDATVTGEVTVQADTKIITNNAKLPEIDATIEDITVVEDKKSSTTKRPSGGGGGGGSRPTTSDLTISEEKAVTSGTYNNVTITDAVADGEVTLSGVTVKGDLTIKGGGSSSIKLDTCTIQGKVIMAKETGEAPRLELTNTPINNVEVQKPAIIEAVDSASAVTKIEATANIEIKGENTKIDTLAVPETAESAVAITVTAGSVATVEAKAETSVTGASNSVDTIVATAAVTADSEAVQKVEIPETATESVSVTVTGDASVDIEINSTSGAAVTGENITVSTTLETAPDNITIGGEAVTHIHKWGEPEVLFNATCEQDGRKLYTCIADGCTDPVMTKKESIPALGHSYGEWKKSDDDLHVRECANDKEHYEKQEHFWDEGKITTEANCGQCGVKTYTCSVCKGTKTETIDQIDHNWGDWVKVDTTSHKRVCKNNAEHIETADHTPVIDDEIEATCTETGKTEGSHCDICNSVIVEQTTTPALNHDFTGEYKKDADGHWHICTRDNCEETDTKASHNYNTNNCAEIATCTLCNYVKPDGEHSWGDYIKLDDFNHKRNCSACDEPEIKAHSWNEGVITAEPTPTNAGVKTYTCFECKGTKTESVPYVPKTEINFSKSGNSIRVEWSGYTASKYIFRLFDEEGNKIAESAETSSTNYSDISIYMPTPDTGVNKYKFVLYSYRDGVATELDSLEDAITITVGADAVDYEIAYNEVAENEHSITWKNGIVPSGINYIGIWKNANGTQNEKISGAISQYGIVHRKYGYQNLTFDLRVISSFDVLEGKVALTMTPPSEKKYTEPSSVNNYTFVENHEGNPLRISWEESELALEYGYRIKFDGYNMTVGTSRTVTGLAPVLASADLQSGKLSIEMYTGPNWTELTPVYASAEIATITLGDTVPEFTIKKDENGKYNFVSALAGGMWVYNLYDSDGNDYFVNNDINGAIDSYANFADGHTVKARYVTWTLNDDKTFAEIMVTQQAEYTYNEPLSLLSFRKWNTDIMFDGYKDVQDTKSLEVNGVKVVSSKQETMSELLFEYDQTKGNIIDADFVVELDGVEKERISKNVDVTLSNTDVAFTINTDGTLSFDATTHGSFAYKTTKGGAGRIAFNNGSLVAGWDLPTLTDGEAIDIMHIDCVYEEASKTISATISRHTTKTYTEPASSDVQITLVQDGNKIKATWSGTDSPNYYFMFADENGTLSGGWWVDGVCEIPDLVTFFPRVDTSGVLSFVLYAATADYDIGEELARLENCFDITVSGEPMNYEMAFNNPENGNHTITLGTAIPANVYHLGAWYRNNRLTSMDSGKASYETAVGSTFTRNQSSIQDGDVYDLRLLTTYTLEGQTIKATMTPESKKTYVANNVKIALVQNGTNIEATWTGANCDNGYTWALIEDGDIHQLDFVGKNVSATSDFKPCLTRIDSGVHSYDFVLYEYDESAEDCIGKELARLEKAIEVTIAGESVGYTMSFTAPADGQYQITLNAVPTEGNTYLTRWNRGRSNYSSIYVSDGNQTYTETTFMGALQSGDIYDLRLLTTYILEGQTIKAVMTPPSNTTYTAATEKNIWFSDDNEKGRLHVEWTAVELADNEYYWFDGWGNKVSYYNILKVLGSIETDETMSIVVEKGTSDNRETLYSVENALTVSVEGNVQSYTITGQADGTYTITAPSNDFSRKGFIYEMCTNDGTKITSGYSQDGNISAALYDGCSIKVREVKWTIGENGQTANVVLTPINTITTYTECPISEEIVAVTTFEELETALAIGGKVQLSNNITSNSNLMLYEGAPAELILNGYTLDLPVLQLDFGKTLTIDGTAEGSKIQYSSGTNKLGVYYYSSLTINGGTYQNMNCHTIREIVINGGTFSFDPTEYVDTTTHTVTDNEDGTYTVAQKTE